MCSALSIDPCPLQREKNPGKMVTTKKRGISPVSLKYPAIIFEKRKCNKKNTCLATILIFIVVIKNIH
jgi:hypothetical protein